MKRSGFPPDPLHWPCLIDYEIIQLIFLVFFAAKEDKPPFFGLSGFIIR